MRLLVITSFTGEKVVKHEQALTLPDFEQDPAYVKQREQMLQDLITPAGEIYTGLQHVRLMRGVQTFQQQSAGKPATDNALINALGPGMGETGI